MNSFQSDGQENCVQNGSTTKSRLHQNHKSNPCTDSIKGNDARLGCGLETTIFLRRIACRADYCGLSRGNDFRLFRGK